MFVLVVTVAGAAGQSNPLFPAELAFLVSLSWCSSIRYFRYLEEVKVSAIEELEQDMSFTAFRNEREKFRQKYQRGQALTQIEMLIPTALLTCSVLVLVYILIKSLLASM